MKSPSWPGGRLARSVPNALCAIFLVSLCIPVLNAQTAGSPKTTVDSSKDRDPHAVQPERPTVATHAGTVAPGWFELETGVERDHYGPAANSYVTPTVLKFGIADNVQFSLFGSVAKSVGLDAGVGDLATGIKWRLVDDAPIVGDFAVLPSIKFPTGSMATGTGTGTTDVSILLISSHSIGSVAMDLNVGYTRRSGDGSTVSRNATVWTASFGGPFGSGPIGWVGELYGYPATGGPAGQSSIVALLGGPTLQIRSWLVGDAGVIVPMSGPQPKAIYAGAVYNIGRLWEAR
jgi:outer membrane putative beta-barrel porin/alpha-amylase